jgi:uncharacterized protein (TIGR00255 family)
VADATLLSMTGFGAGEAVLGRSTLRVELRSVNHRSLDVRTRLPSELSEHAPSIEELVRAGAVRGRVEAHVQQLGAEVGQRGPSLDQLRTAHALLAELQREVSPGADVPLAAVVQLAAMSRDTGNTRDAALDAALRIATAQALDGLRAMRATEGAALARDLGQRVAALREHTRLVSAGREAQLDAYRERLQARIRRLLDASDVLADPQRIAHEVAWMAERSDVAEELTRLESHLGQFEAALTPKDDAGVGRRLEFLVQEMGREVNTLGSKAGDADVAQRVIAMKAELDRIREQVANVL